MSQRTVLVINSGSSSIKYQLVDPDSGQALASGIVERIGDVEGSITHKHNGHKTTFTKVVPDHSAGLREVLSLFDTEGPSLDEAGVVAVGHRVVQGGLHFSGPVLADDEVLACIEEQCPLAPLHNPANLKGIQVARELMPDVPQVCVFDTAFFRDLPDEASRYALNREVAEKFSIRRYGAHGTSHQFVSASVAEMLGRDDLKQVVLHIGNGASASAVVAGKAVDTSMGLTPLEGLVMGSRTGDIDPATTFHLARVAGMSINEIDALFNRESGMKGMTGQSDMREVRRLINEGDENAASAVGVYIHRLIKYVGAYTAVMGGLDALTFTAGVGENDAYIRSAVCTRLAYMGITVDESKNPMNIGEPTIISTPDSAVTVLVYPTNEELAIARQTISLL